MCPNATKPEVCVRLREEPYANGLYVDRSYVGQDENKSGAASRDP